MATLKDVAKLAGVSTATASLSLNGKSVNEATRSKVISCAKELNYVPIKSGRTLSTGRSNIVQLLIINSVKCADCVKETSYYNHIIQGIVKVMQKYDYGLHFDVQMWESSALPEYFKHKIKDKSTDGIIIIPQFRYNYGFLDSLLQSGFPYVILNPCVFDENINNITLDHNRGGALVAELFIQLQYKKVALIGGPVEHFDTIERGRGFVSKLAEESIFVPEQARYYGDFTVKSGFKGMEKILYTYRPEAVFCFNDYMAAGAIRCLHERGIRIPDEIAVVGYDNIEIATAVYPELTSIDYNIEKLGKQLAESLWKLISNEESQVHIVIRPRLVMRSSCKTER